MTAALIASTLSLLVLAVALAGAFAATGDARYAAAMVASGLAAYCTAEPVRQQPAGEVQP